jgi:hypothetical protein
MSDDGIETRLWGIRIWPFRASVSLSRSPHGAHFSMSIYILKLGLHFSISAID